MLFASLFHALRQHGFTLTVEHELRLQRLLPHLDQQCRGPEDLRDLLCPLFATTQEQQQAFGPIFEDWLHRSGAKIALAPTKEATPPPDPWYARRLTYLLLTPVLAAALWWLIPQTQPEPQKPPPAKIETRTETIQTPNGPAQQQITTTLIYKTPDWVRQWEARRPWLWSGTALALLLWTLFEIYRWRRRRMIMQRERAERQKAPHQLPLHLAPHHLGLAQHTTLHEAARRLRTREAAAHTVLDLPATIRAAVQRAGFLPGFAFRRQTREPAYLMLIDRRSFQDHQMLLFDEYARALHQRNVDITALYFEGDPRYPVGLDWRTLRQRHHSARLILATDGESLRHPATGALFPWVEREFSAWEHRALLTPVEPARWSLREHELARVFTPWPATAAGLLALSQHWTGESALRHQPETTWTPLPQWRDVTDAPRLRAYLGEAAYRWLCACARLPELQWDLTLRLATVLGLPAQRDPDRLRLFSLEWFRQGFIPREWCYRLVADLDHATSQTVTQAILAEFEKAPEPAEPHDAGQLRRLWLQFHKLWPGRDTLLGWLRLRRWMRSTSPETLQRDSLVARSLDTLRRSPLDFILPRRLSQQLHESGASLLGLRTVFRFAAVGLAAVCALAWLGWQEYRIRDTSAEEQRTVTIIVVPTKPDKPTDVKVDTITVADIKEEYVLIPKGTFQMGCSPGDGECFPDEKPVHQVTLTRDYYLGRTEVTVANYGKFVAATKRKGPKRASVSKSEQDPVVNVVWADAQAYCAHVGGRLPTEAEWEYAARGGRPEGRYGPLDEIAWYDKNSGVQLHPVGQKKPNAYGLFDMLGNAFEWTADGYNEYDSRAVADPEERIKIERRVVRGGSRNNRTRGTRASYRVSGLPGGRLNYLGFRCVRPAR